nr:MULTISPECIES: enoyl-CoA hydratase-related protein [Protofrankia]
MDATEAESAGLVSRIVPAEGLVDEALDVAEKIAGMSTPVAMMVKEAVNRAFETSLSEGALFERRTFHATFATADQKEGMAAFTEKRRPVPGRVIVLPERAITMGRGRRRVRPCSPLNASDAARPSVAGTRSVGRGNGGCRGRR